MFKELGLARSFLVYALVVPLALLLGYVLASPTDAQSLAVISLIFLALAFPIFLRWHHAILVFCWNAIFIVFFLPGKPGLWTVLACGSLFLAILRRTMQKREELFIQVPSIMIPLVMLSVVVLFTALHTGGFGGRALGSELWGAKRYLGVFGSIIGYFALVTQRIPPERAKLYVYMFFLSGVTAVVSDLVYAAGPSFYFLYALFSPEAAGSQAIATGTSFMRLTGVAWASLSGYWFLLVRYSIGGLFELTKPWRLLALLAVAGAGLLGGFRSSVILMVIVFWVQFYCEGLFRSHLFPILIFMTVITGVFTVAFINKLPWAVQRSLSFLPLDVDPAARIDATSTLDWRLQMWKVVLPEVPQYIFMGKGYAFSGTDYYLTEEAISRGFYTAYESTLISGNYHNGFLTVIIPFGIFGFLFFGWFCWSAIRALYRNARYGDPAYQQINTFLLAYFIARLLFYFIFYGQFDLDLPVFLGVIGLSISLNGGVCQPATEDVLEEAPVEPALAPSAA